MLKHLHFSHRIKVLLRPSTNANLCYLKFDLTNCSWEKNYFSATIGARGSAELSKFTGRSSSTISLSIWRMEEYSFNLFHLVFWKRALVLVVVALDFLDIFVPKVHWGLKKTWRKNQEFLKKFDDFWRNFVRLLFQICLIRSKRFQILPLDGGPQHLIYLKLC